MTLRERDLSAMPADITAVAVAAQAVRADRRERGGRPAKRAGVRGRSGDVPEDERRLVDGGVLALPRASLPPGARDGLGRWQPERGSPRGAATSLPPANLDLNPPDRRMGIASVIGRADDCLRER